MLFRNFQIDLVDQSSKGAYFHEFKAIDILVARFS